MEKKHIKVIQSIISNETRTFGKPFEHLFQYMSWRTKTVGEYQAGEREREPRVREWETQCQREKQYSKKRTKMLKMIYRMNIHDSRYWQVSHTDVMISNHT